jgi:hypothetical protein
MSEPITLPIVFGPKSNDKLLTEDGYCKLILKPDCILTRTYYEYECLKDKDDPLSGKITKLVHERSVTPKRSVVKLYVSWDDEEEVYFVGMDFLSGKYYMNVESAEAGDDLLKRLTTWLMSNE